MPEMKIKDIADELNTKSKRVIEKLEEIKITGKGPMSKLDEQEVQKLYEYITISKGTSTISAYSSPASCISSSSSA